MVFACPVVLQQYPHTVCRTHMGYKTLLHREASAQKKLQQQGAGTLIMRTTHDRARLRHRDWYIALRRSPFWTDRE